MMKTMLSRKKPATWCWNAQRNTSHQNSSDSILVFNKLSKGSILEVVSLRLKDVADRLRDLRITLDVDDGAKDWLVQGTF